MDPVQGPHEAPQPVVCSSEKSAHQCLQLLGLAVRARRVAFGSDAVLSSVVRKEAHLVFLASDAGENSAKKFRDKCAFYGIPIVIAFDRTALGRACGKENAVAIAVTDPGFAAKMGDFAGDISGGVLFDKTSRV
jgi:ribosomal protein L7Ae-like RNA K-turn-binding protein